MKYRNYKDSKNKSISKMNKFFIFIIDIILKLEFKLRIVKCKLRIVK